MGMELSKYAKGVVFNAKEHTYHLNGKKLSGITKLIRRRLGIKMPEEYTGEAMTDGIHVHKAVEDWINTGKMESIHPGAAWVQQELSRAWNDPCKQCNSEMLVSDGKKYASAVDIFCKTPEGRITLYDIKRTFNRMFVTWQLSIYAYFIKKTDPTAVIEAAYCLAVRDRAVYRIFFLNDIEVEDLLYGEPEPSMEPEPPMEPEPSREPEPHDISKEF